MHTLWFQAYAQATLNRKSKTSVIQDNKIIYLKWYPAIQDSGFNCTYIDEDLSPSHLNDILHHTKEYATSITTHQQDLEKKYPDNLALAYTTLVRMRTCHTPFILKTPLKIKKVATLADFKIWIQLAHQCFPDYSPDFIYKSYKADWQNEYIDFYMGFENEIPVACACITASDQVAILAWVGVIDDYRSKGYGFDIVGYSINDYIEKGYQQYMLLASKMGVPLYTKMGFDVQDTLYQYNIVKSK